MVVERTPATATRPIPMFEQTLVLLSLSWRKFQRAVCLGASGVMKEEKFKDNSFC